MTDTIAAIANAMHADAETLRVISQNVANTQTPAYLREIPLARSSFDALAASAAADLATPAGSGADGLLDLTSAIDLRPGTLQSTGEPLDLAIEGSGFFVVSGAQGERLTRRGDFHLDAQGTLVTLNGDAVLGASGPIHLNAGRPAIAPDGTVRLGDAVIDRLRLVSIADPGTLQAAGDGTYVLAPGEQPLESNGSQVRQGFLETSNVQSVNEMITLMETLRRFETAQRFVRGYDEMVDKAITTLGKV